MVQFYVNVYANQAGSFPSVYDESFRQIAKNLMGFERFVCVENPPYFELLRIDLSSYEMEILNDYTKVALGSNGTG